ncbi:MAG: hypothetical protein IPI55_01255 [Flavobacteriales bacterium]|nr:hypothetical protein [Flavobacteriales bacterium]
MTDAEIIAGFLSPDTRAQDKAITFFSDSIKGPIIDHVRANSGTRLEALDLVQEVIVALYQLVKKPGFVLNTGTKLSTLAWSIGRNLWLKVLRERKKTTGDNIEEGMRNEPAETRTALDLMADTERPRCRLARVREAGREVQNLAPYGDGRACHAGDRSGPGLRRPWLGARKEVQVHEPMEGAVPGLHKRYAQRT